MQVQLENVIVQREGKKIIRKAAEEDEEATEKRGGKKKIGFHMTEARITMGS